MKTLLIAFAAGLLASAANSRADLTVVQKIEGMGQNMESTAKFKGSKTRVDAAPNTSIIMALKSGEMIQVVQAEKTFLKVPATVALAAIDSMKKTTSDGSEKPQLVPTGKKETISGFAAEEYTCTIAGTHLSLWLTKALPDYEKALKEMSAAFTQGPMASMMQSYGLDMANLPGFPIRTVNEVQPGQSQTTTVVSVSMKPIADSEFEVPAGFKEISMPTLTPPAGAEVSPAATPGE